MIQIVAPNTKIDFIGNQRIWITVSIILIIASFSLLFFKGVNLGIDFMGGAVIQVKMKDKTSTGELRSILEKQGVKFSLIQRVGTELENEFQLKVKGSSAHLQKLSDTVNAALTSARGNGSFEIRKVDVVGPRAGKALRTSSFWAAFYAIIGILIYIMIRFDFSYSPGAIIALLHDSILILGAFVITQKEFSLHIVAAILTIIGYSINDTIIVFDRIRETITANPDRELTKNVNEGINATLGRTITTSFTTLLAVAALYVFGGGLIHDFAEALFIGVIFGTYSSIFIASPIFLFLAKRQKRLQAAAQS